jgi:catechol 2,3-dioxygenase-like lactoylglutathione lyase family enzyme
MSRVPSGGHEVYDKDGEPVLFAPTTGSRGPEATMTRPTQTVPAWQGINHIALVTPDLAATLRFYQDVLGLRLAALLPASDAHGPHALLSTDGSETGTGQVLHFFEDAAAQIFTDPEALTAVRFVPGALQHIALTLPDEAAGQALHARLQELGIPTTGIEDLRLNQSFRTLDPMGLIVEVAWRKPGQAPLS